MEITAVSKTSIDKMKLSRRNRVIGWTPVVFFIGLAVSVYLFYSFHSVTQERVTRDFEHAAQKRVSAIYKEFAELEIVPVAFQAFMGHVPTGQHLDSEFGDFVQEILDDEYHIRALAWVLPNADHSHTSVLEPDACSYQNTSDDHQPFKLCLLAPFGNGEALLANGLTTNPALVGALRRALETDQQFVLSGPPENIEDLTSDQEKHRFFVFPIRLGHDHGADREHVAEEQRGFLVIESYIPDMIENGLELYTDGGAGVDIYLVDSLDAADAQPLHIHFSRLRDLSIDGPSRQQLPDINDRLVRVMPLQLGGANWKLVLAAVPAAFDLTPGVGPLSVLFVGIMLSALLAIILSNTFDKRKYAELLVAKRTQDLTKANDLLVEEIHKKQSIEKEIQQELLIKNTFNAVLEVANAKISLNEKLQKTLDLILDADWLSIETRGSIFLVDKERGTLALTVQRGLAEPLLKSCANISFGQCLCGKAAAEQEIVFTNCVNHQHHITYEGIKEHGHYCVPILSDQKTIGVLNLYVEHNHQHSRNEELFLTMVADILSTVIERKQDEITIRDTLRELDFQKQALDEHAIVSITDVRGNITYANNKLCEISQYSITELKGHNHRMLNSGVQSKKFFRTLWRTIVQGQTWKGEICNKKKDGSYYWVAATIVPFLDDKGKPYKYVAVHMDITALKAAEHQLIKRNKEIEQAHEELEESHHMMLHSEKLASVGQLAAGIAHEINTPTQFIGDNTRFLQETFDDLLKLVDAYEKLSDIANGGGNCQELVNQARSMSKKIEIDYLVEEVPKAISQSLEGIERVSDIVRSMKDFSHPGSEQQEIIDINKAIESTVTVSRNEWRYDAELVTDFDEVLTNVPCYLGEFNQAILNIIVNAAHAIRDARDGDGELGKIMISTWLENDYAEISIQDTGIGMSKAVQKRIFEPFYTTKGVGKGSGQGLAIAYSIIVEKHHGSISVNSNPGEGTIFIIRLPMRNSVTFKERELSYEKAYSVCR